MSRPRLWTRDFVLAWGVSLFLSLIFYLLMTSMAGYAVSRFGVGQAAAGLASSGFVVGAVAGRILVGKYLDFIGRKRLMLIVLAAFVVCSALYFVASPAWVLIALRIVHGVGYGFGHTAMMTAAQSLLPDERRGEGTGYFAMSASLATAVGPLVVVFLIDSFGYGWLFAASVACSALGLLLMLFVRLPERAPTDSEKAEKWRLSIAGLVESRALPIAWVIFLGGMAYSTVLSFLNGFADGEHLGNAAGVYFLVYAATTLLSRFFAGRLQDRFGDRFVVFPALVLYTVGMGVLAAAANTWMVVLAAVVIGLGFGSSMPALQTAAVKLVEPARVGVAVSTFFLMLDVGTGIGPVALGALAPTIGARGIYWCAAILVAVSIGVYAWVARRRSAQ